MKYEPGKGIYLEDHEWEADIRNPEKNRPGQMDLKQAALERDGYQCRVCGSLVVSETSHIDHIKVELFASPRRIGSFILREILASWLAVGERCCGECDPSRGEFAIEEQRHVLESGERGSDIAFTLPVFEYGVVASS